MKTKLAVLSVLLTVGAALCMSAPAPLPRKLDKFNIKKHICGKKFDFTWQGQKGDFLLDRDGTYVHHLGSMKYYGTWRYDDNGKLWTFETVNGQNWSVYVYHLGTPHNRDKFSCDVFNFNQNDLKESWICLTTFKIPTEPK